LKKMAKLKNGTINLKI